MVVVVVMVVVVGQSIAHGKAVGIAGGAGGLKSGMLWSEDGRRVGGWAETLGDEVVAAADQGDG